MYSAVLMLALTAGTETADFGRSRCSGCNSGYTTCSVSYGCSSSYGCSGCTARHGLFNRGHGCNSCSSSCFSGGHGRRGCNCQPICSGCSYYGGYSCACSGGVIITQPVTPKTMPKQGEKIEGPKKEASVDAPATIVVSLPADARLTVDGTATTSTSNVRTLVTPILANGSTYVYTFQAQVTREGRVLTQNQEVTVRGGETSNVQFNFSTTGVASR